MNRLGELIYELCPDGVEYKFLRELEEEGSIELGRGKVISKKDLAEYQGDYPVYSSSASETGEFGRYGLYMFEDERISWSIDGGGRFFYRPPHKYSVTNVSGWLKVKNNLLNTKFLYYVLSNAWATKVFNYTNKAHPSVIRDAYRMPVPPLPVQQEIVRILDNFTELTAELTAEFTARKKQYEYYRDELLMIDGCEKKSFGEIATIVRGASPRPIQKFITDDKNGINWIKIGDVSAGSKYITSTNEKITKEGARNSRFVHPGDFVLSNSMSFGRPYIMKIEGCIHDGWLSISGFEASYSADFLYHLLSSSVIQKAMAQRASNGTVKNLNADIVKSLELPIPSMDLQERIVAILDRFDTLTTDITSGLPAEIEARRKQYEYYRDKLLTFKEAKK